MSNTLGPVTLTPWTSAVKMMVKDKKEFWVARRRAVGGRTETGSASGSDDESEDDVVASLFCCVQLGYPSGSTYRPHGKIREVAS